MVMYPLHKTEYFAKVKPLKYCEKCGFANVYIQCKHCIEWKLKLQEKPSFE